MGGKTLSPLVAFCVAAGALVGAPAKAGPEEWTSLGPFGGSVTALAIDPQTPTTLYAGGFGSGVFKSLDGGGHWTATSDGLDPGAEIDALAIDPQAPATLFAIVNRGAVYKSMDGGGHWSPLYGPGVSTLAVDPQVPANLYVGRLGRGVYKSTDGGNHWSPANEGLPELDEEAHTLQWARFHSLAIDPQTPTTLYVGVCDPGEDGECEGALLYKSTDGGGHWSPLGEGLPPWTDRLTALAIDPRSPEILYAAAWDFGGPGTPGVFKSTDGGEHWVAANERMPVSYVAELAIDPQSPQTLYAGTSDGVFKSGDGGSHWTAVSEGLSVATLAIDPQTSSVVYAGTWSGGVYKSTDGGGRWTAVNEDLASTSAWALAIDPLAPGTLYAETPRGLFRSVDRGSSWADVSAELTCGGLRLAVDPRTPGTLYAGWVGVCKSTDGGDHWIRVSEGLPDESVWALAIDPQTPSTLYAGTAAGVYKTTDGGGLWNAASSGLPTHGEDYTWIWALAIDPLTPTTLYSATSRGVYRSTDGGVRWEAASDGLSEFPEGAFVTALAVDPQNPATVYAGVYFDGVYRTEDGGEHWSAMSEGFPEHGPAHVEALAIDAVSPDRVYAGLRGMGVVRWNERDGRWTELGLGTVWALGLDPAWPPTLYAGTDRGVFSLHLKRDRRVLSLRDDRFEVSVDWRDFQGATGSGTVAVVAEETDEGVSVRSPDSMVGQFFSPDNWELLFKILDGRVLNGHFWVFLSAATNVEVTTTVTDTSCGESRTYVNALGRAAPAVTDVTAFSECDEPPPTVPCREEPGIVCLGEGGRFRVETAWRDFAGNTGAVGQVTIPRTGLARSDDSGLFYFFSDDNWELLVKVLDGCAVNDRYWVYSAATTNVEYTVTVTDTDTDEERTYTNPLGRAADAVTDSDAFATCP